MVGTRKSVVHFFDEAREIPEDSFQHFVKQLKGYAAFTSTTTPTRSESYVSPAELLNS